MIKRTLLVVLPLLRLVLLHLDERADNEFCLGPRRGGLLPSINQVPLNELKAGM